MNAFVITLSLTSIALSWMIALLQLPLPEINPAFYARLNELKVKDKGKYEEEMRAVIAESARRERLLFSVASLMVFMLAYATISTVWYPNAQDELGRFITRAFLGSLLAVGVGDAAASMIKKACYRGFFRRYPTESDHRLKMYIRLGKVIGGLRIVLVLDRAAPDASSRCDHGQDLMCWSLPSRRRDVPRPECLDVFTQQESWKSTLD